MGFAQLRRVAGATRDTDAVRRRSQGGWGIAAIPVVGDGGDDETVPLTPRASRPRTDANPLASVVVTAAVIVVVVVHNVLVAVGVNEMTTLVANIAFASGLVVVATRAGVSPRALGLRITSQGATFALFGIVVIVVLVGVAAGLHVLPPDSRLSSLTRGEVLFRAVIAIPIGTAVCEELIFRGVLFAAWDRVRTRAWSTLGTSAMFGLWHVAAEAQRTGSWSIAVLVGVLATAAASALVLCPLRRIGGDLAAPIAVHAAANVSVFVAMILASGGVA